MLIWINLQLIKLWPICFRHSLTIKDWIDISGICSSFNLVDDHHGVYFLEKKIKKIQVNSTNKNDLIKILGEPSTKSSFDNDVWIYIERKITNTHFLGKRELVVNNVLVQIELLVTAGNINQF